nr:IclR family transcriptional regulator [Halovulum dunhuangense]
MSGAQSVDRALALLSLIGRHSREGVSLSELVVQSGLNKATVRRLLLALIRAGQVEQDGDSRLYHLGEEAYVLGLMAAGRHGLLKTAMPSLMRLARSTGDAAFVSVRRGAFAVCLHREDGPHPIRTYALMPGYQHPLGVGAGSLAMLAALPDDEVEAVLDTNAALLSESYPRLSAEVLRRHVAETRTTGIALNPGLIFEDSWGLGIALRGPDGGLAGALSLAAVESRMRESRRAELVPRLRQEASEIENRLAQSYAARPGHLERKER